MSYRTQAILSQNDQLMMRIAACASLQKIEGPVAWAYNHQWQLSATSGWDAAFAAAVAAGTANPGNNETVITDSMILSAVQSIVAAEAPAP